MNAHEKTTLRRLRALMARVDPDGWFIEPGLSNRAVLQALDAADEAMQQAVAALINSEREAQRYLARLNLLEAAVETMVPLAKVQRLEEQLKEEGRQLSEAHDALNAAYQRLTDAGVRSV